MGIEYTALLQDDSNWQYVGKSKETVFREIEAAFSAIERPMPELLGSWYGFMVLDCHKTSIWLPEYAKILLKHCDTAHYWDDGNPYEIKKLTV
jgi:hypothetical protein